ncbi:micrococcal nuclease-like nuclease [Mesorhizobium australicum WSM2073]|uniref:Micrococcal nuclease-like nuclease n=1 Tax=Mesorhizobium australicum (strain HAMBI 3006 / LMG 24608 / WSM2073) TaxID=754035 RepID=L0KT83_MESAW|nr:thermonuclease family protein [Mesorhizobium sp. B283B1A]AGB47890.1 micrococcal nuclease-like nuclease [Mesorhizobium australicum WSM2073]
MQPEDDLKSRIEAALVRGHFTQWQRQFLLDMRDRLVKYGPRTRLSAKQWAKLYEIIGPAPPNANASPQSRSDRPPSSPRWQTRRWRSPLAREARYLAARFARTFGIALALIVGSLIYSFIIRGGHVTWPSMPSFARSGGSEWVPLARTQFTITDGDTIRLNGAAKGTRLVGFNAPESIEPRCDSERDLGRRAKARLKELVAEAKLELKMVPCSCPAGTEGTDKCNYGRRCGLLFADGRDVGDVLVSEGLAVSFVCGSTSCPPTPRPWCG